MQLIHDHSPVLLVKGIKDIGNMNTSIRDPSSHNIEVKEKISSDASLFLMNPVASGDNMLTDLNNGQKLKEELPLLVPCCEGKELQINKELVCTGLSAISVKHDSVFHCLSMSSACEKMQVPPGTVKHRNSFRSLHRPELKRVPYLRRMTPDEIESLFLGYADLPALLNTNDKQKENTRSVRSPDEHIEIRSTTQDKTVINLNESNGGLLQPIPETRSGAEDVPSGMRLHGARARLYTSVLAGTKTGDQLDNASATEEYDTQVPDDMIPDDEIQLKEELQIILPPRCDDITADSSITNSETSTT